LKAGLVRKEEVVRNAFFQMAPDDIRGAPASAMILGQEEGLQEEGRQRRNRRQRRRQIGRIPKTG